MERLTANDMYRSRMAAETNSLDDYKANGHHVIQLMHQFAEQECKEFVRSLRIPAMSEEMLDNFYQQFKEQQGSGKMYEV